MTDNRAALGLSLFVLAFIGTIIGGFLLMDYLKPKTIAFVPPAIWRVPLDPDNQEFDI